MHPGEANDLPASVQVVDQWFGPKRFAVLLGLLLVAAFPGVVLGFNSFFFRDYGTLGYPLVAYHHERFWQGELPLWNPLSNCGTPFLAQWNTLVLYPLSLIYLVFPLPWSLNYFCLAHLALAGWGMYCLVRRWVGNPFAASVAGVAFLFSGVTLSSHIYPNYLVTLGWMPFVVWFTERAWNEGGRWIVAAAVVGALQMLSGAPELILQTWAIVLTLALVARRSGPVEVPSRPEPIDIGNPKGSVSNARPMISCGRLLAVVLLVAGLCAAQLWPFCDLLAHSQRSSGYSSQLWTMPSWGWSAFLVPLFHCYHTTQGVFFQSGQAFLVSYYLGVGVVGLALVGCWRAREPRVWALAILTAVTLVLALGEHGWLYGWLRMFVPGFSVMRFPIKFVYLAAFTVPLLAAYGVRALGSSRDSGSLGDQPLRPSDSSLDQPQVADPRPESRPGRAMTLSPTWGVVCLITTLGAMTVLLAAFARLHPSPEEDWRVTATSAGTRLIFLVAILLLACWRDAGRRPHLAWLTRFGLLVLVWLDVQTHTPHVVPVINNSAYRPGLLEIQPKPEPSQTRVMISPRAEWLLMTRTLPDFLQDFLGSRLALWSNLNALEGVAKVNGAATLQLREEAQVEGVLYASTTNEYPHLADFLGAGYVSSPANPVEWVARTNAMPLVTAGQGALFLDPNATFRRLFSAEFNPGREVCLPLEARGLVTATNPASARLHLRRFDPERLEAKVDAAGATWLVVAQSFHPSWQACVDERPARLWRANYAFQALEVPAGSHQVRLVYRDLHFRMGAGISLGALLVCGWWWYRCRPGAARPSSPVPDSRPKTA